MPSSEEEIEEALVVWSLAGLSLTLIIAIAYYTIRDLMKHDEQHLSVLKDQNTVFFVTTALLSLTFKIAIIDTYFKNEIKNARVCSMFISDFMPQFFIALSSVLVAVKAILLVFVSRDTLSSYKKSYKMRQRRATLLMTPIYLILFILMNLRFSRTCYRAVEAPLQDDIDIRTYIHFMILYTVKLLCIICLLVCFIVMKDNRHLSYNA